MKFSKSLLTLMFSLLIVSESAMAGLPPPPISVPVDSPWMIMGLAVLLATVGARLFNNRRK